MLSHFPLTLSKDGMTTDKSLDEALDVVICNENMVYSTQQEDGGCNLRYLEIYLTQLKKRLDMKELSAIRGTPQMQGPPPQYVALENIVA